MMNIEYNSYLENLAYGDGYDIRIHYIQTALSLLGFLNTEGVNKNEIKYGYYCVNTELMIKKFQSIKKLVENGIITKETWDSLTNALENIGCQIVQTGDKQITLVGIDNKLDENDWNNYYENEGQETINNNNYQSNANGSITMNGNYTYGDMTGSEIYEQIFSEYLLTGVKSSVLEKEYQLDGSINFDELLLEYIINGGVVHNGIRYSFNMAGGEDFGDSYLPPMIYDVSGAAKDYDYIYNLIANTNYNNNLNILDRTNNSFNTVSETSTGIFFEENSQKPFFSKTNTTSKIRGRNFDITIVYGPLKKDARKIIGVVPIAVSQEVNASGEPIYDVYEFIAKDVLDYKQQY